jgi:hypothetical protein
MKKAISYKNKGGKSLSGSGARMCSSVMRKRRLVMNKNIFLIGFVIILGMLLSETNVQSQQIDCYASLKAYAQDPRMRDYTCSCPNGRYGMPVCKPKSSSGSYVVRPSGNLDPSQQLAVGIAGALFNSLFSDLFSDSSASSSANAYQQQLRQQQEEQREKERQAALDAWNKALATAEQDALEEQQKKREQGSALVRDHGITGGGGDLEPMWITQKPEAKPLQSGGYSTSGLTQDQRLACASYFSTRARDESKKGDLEAARFFNEQADKVMVGAKTDVACEFPQMANVPTPKPQQMEPEKFAVVMKNFDVKLKELQNIKVELNKARQEKQAAEENLKEADKKVVEIKNQMQSLQKPEEKAQADDLLRQALAERSDAEDQVNTAKQNEKELINKTKEMEKDVNAQFKTIQQQGE